MLVYEKDGNVLSFCHESIKRRFDGRVLRFCVYDEEVLLRIGRLGYMLFVLVL